MFCCNPPLDPRCVILTCLFWNWKTFIHVEQETQLKSGKSTDKKKGFQREKKTGNSQTEKGLTKISFLRYLFWCCSFHETKAKKKKKERDKTRNRKKAKRKTRRNEEKKKQERKWERERERDRERQRKRKRKWKRGRLKKAKEKQRETLKNKQKLLSREAQAAPFVKLSEAWARHDNQAQAPARSSKGASYP